MRHLQTTSRHITRANRARLHSVKAAAMSGAPGKVKLLVVSSPDSPELSVLKRLPPTVEIVATGKSLQELAHLTAEDWGSIDVLLNCGVGPRAATRADIQSFWPKLTGLKWMHSSSAGLEHLLFPELIDSPVLLTNARGVYSHSLAEYTLTCCSWFAKDFPRLLQAKADKKWDVYEVEELRGKTFGVIGYGDIGQACARIARAFKMRVVGLRRRVELSAEEASEGLVDKMYGTDQLNELMAASDYVVMATPHTPATNKMVNAAAIAAMKPNGVFINVGRGKCVDEAALIEALTARKIRGAALDVFETEPLPASSPLWDLPNVVMTSHCADRTKEFQQESLEFFVTNLGRYISGQQLQNVCDKKAGY